jgi:hypothetical protein
VKAVSRPGRVWRAADGFWHWDVRLNGMRSTGGRATWREAYDTALYELAWMGSIPGNYGGG